MEEKPITTVVTGAIKTCRLTGDSISLGRLKTEPVINVKADKGGQ
jgi:hypothetical protein